MSTILLKWLAKRLGMIMECDPVYFGTHAADGTLIARLLQSYGIITAEQMSIIQPSTLPSVRLQNLRHLRTWLKFIGVPLEDTTVQNIAMGKGEAAVRLFYELFLCLENKQSLYLVSQQKGRETYGALTSRFRVMTVPETAVEENGDSFNTLAAPLAKKVDIIEWYRDKQNSLRDKIKATRKKLSLISAELQNAQSTNLPEKQTKADTILAREKEDVKYLSCDKAREYRELTYGELMKLQAHGEDLQRKNDYIDRKAASIYMSSLKKLSRKKAAHKAFKAEMQRMILTELWENIEEKREKAFNKMISEKLLKQSQYEKQITTKLYNIRNEQKIIIENRRRIDKMELERREEDIVSTFDRNNNLSEDYKYERRFDREMNIELHKKLYKEKIEMKSKMRFDICKNIVGDIVDFAICAADFRSVYSTNNIPERIWDDWKNVFLASLPLFSTPVPQLEETQNPLKDLDAVAEEQREYVLYNYEMNDYINLLHLWSVDKCLPNQDESFKVSEKLILLGHIVHRLLFLKYPLPPPPVPPDIPSVAHAVALIGLQDGRATSLLSQLLDYQGIRVLHLDSVIKFCLDAYKQEAGNIDMNLIAKTKSNTQESKLKPSKRNVEKSKTPTKSIAKHITDASADENTGEERLETSAQEKATQTPRSIPHDDDVLSHQATLGKKAFEILSIGESIDDSLLIEMFVEYLKINADMKGWVLLNYPLTYSQASQLEQRLLGIELPFFEEDVETMELLENIEQREIKDHTYSEEPFNKFSESKILPNPIPKPKYDPPKTYLTKYVTLKKNKTQHVSTEEDGVEELTSTDQENISPLEAFYIDQGVSYTFYHDVFDLHTIKKLARFIIEDEQIQRTPSIELFGENIKDIEESLISTGKKGKPSSSKKKLSSKKMPTPEDEAAIKAVPQPVHETEQIKEREEALILPEKQKNMKEKRKIRDKKNKGKGGSDAKTERNKEKIKGKIQEYGPAMTEDVSGKSEQIEYEAITAVTEPEISGATKRNEGIFSSSNTRQMASPESPKPDEESCEYIDLYIPEEVAVYLATYWENIEEVFIKDFKQIVYGNHLHFYAIKPYLNYVNHNIMTYIDRQDNKQLLLIDFMKDYNEVDKDLREDFETKSELHCRVSELQQKLWDICDQRKKEAENERQRIIKEDWIARELTTLTNCSLRLFQLEVDRFLDTLRILQDYYLSMLKNMPFFRSHDKIEVPTLELPEGNQSRTSTEPQQRKRSRSNSVMRGDGFKEFVAEILINCDRSTMHNTPFHYFIERIVQQINDFIDNMSSDCEKVLQTQEEILNPRDTVKAKKKKQKKEQNLTITLDDSEQKNMQDLREISPRLFKEWQEAIINERNRTKFRIMLIQGRVSNDLKGVLDDVMDEFYNLRETIGERYKDEVECVRTLCDLLCKSIESEVPIQQELVLEKDRFYIRPNIVLYPPTPEITPQQIEERFIEDEFSISQLRRLMEKLKLVAPAGMISTRAFVLIFEDIIICEPEAQSLPKIWYQLKSQEVSEVVQRIYGHGEYIDWKDFLIYALEFKFPTMDKLLTMRQKFRDLDPRSSEVISHEEYLNSCLFYNEHNPNDPYQSLRRNMGLELLFSLFQVAEDKMNYSALLLYFCKDKFPKLGFAKAIAVCVGKRVFTSYGECFAYTIMDEVISKQIFEHKKVAEAAGKHILSKAVEHVFDIVDNVTVSEVSTDSSQETEIEISCINYEDHGVEYTENVDIDETENVDVDESKNIDVEETMNMVENAYEQAESNKNGDKQIQLTINSNTPDKSPSSKTLTKSSNSTEYILSCTPSDYGFCIPFDTLLTILSLCLPWHVKVPNLIDGRSLIKNLENACAELDRGGHTVYIHEFLEHPFTEKLLSIIYKFKSCDIAQEVRNVINNRITYEY